MEILNTDLSIREGVLTSEGTSSLVKREICSNFSVSRTWTLLSRIKTAWTLLSRIKTDDALVKIVFRSSCKVGGKLAN